LPRTGLNFLGDEDFYAYAPVLNEAITTVMSYSAELFTPGDEDCLYLDVYVPGKAVKDTKLKLPVVNWIYGGGFTFGEKEQDGLYDPIDLISRTGNNFIWVAGNYRLGGYGWLAGTTMEKEGLANLGLYDQRMVLEWIQDFIPSMGGDKSNVLSMGESAGASSILHHLVGFGGKQDPLFNRAVIMSPAFQMKWDRAGLLEEVYKNFTREAGCAIGGLECLRRMPADQLRKANRAIQDYAPRGTFTTGPAVDGSWVRQLPAVEFLEGKRNL
jgi:carboxylesterase type B